VIWPEDEAAAFTAASVHRMDGAFDKLEPAQEVVVIVENAPRALGNGEHPVRCGLGHKNHLLD
jgi:hypothetical protein